MEAGAVVEAACMQQYAAAVAWVWQQAACVCAAAGGSGRGNDCDGRHAASGMQPACVRQWAANAACMQQRAAAAVCVQQRAGAAGSTIAMGYSDGSGQPVAQLQWAAAVAAAAQRMAGRRKNHDEQRLQQLATVG